MDLSFSIEKESARSFQNNKHIGLLFFEASTRTRVSFELACAREGCHSFLMTHPLGTSLEKGESVQDTIDNVLAMKLQLLVIRSGDDFDQSQYFQNSSVPVISAGWGKVSHPTQALLDIRCLLKQGLTFEQMKIVIIGDIKHSRVAHSHFTLAKKLGYEVAIVCSDSVVPQVPVRRLENLEKAFEWGNILMPLRYQKERHENVTTGMDYKPYQITKKSLEDWSCGGYLMHPGPVNYGVEITEDTRSYSNNLILSQVESGVWMRRALIRYLLKDEA